LPKKYAKMGFKRGWTAYKKARRTPTRTRATPVKRRSKTTMARRRSYRKYTRRVKSTLMNKSFIDGVLSVGAKKVLSTFIGSNPLYDAGVDVGLGFIRKNKTLMGQGISNGLLSFIPIGNSNGGSVR